MYTHVQKHHLSAVELFRWSARIFAALLFVTWLGLVTLEVVSKGPFTNFDVWFQAASLAVVFIGYAVGWRHELVGGALAVLGTAAFFAATWLTSSWLPSSQVAWFATPGVLYLLAWLCAHRRCAS